MSFLNLSRYRIERGQGWGLISPGLNKGHLSTSLRLVPWKGLSSTRRWGAFGSSLEMQNLRPSPKTHCVSIFYQDSQVTYHIHIQVRKHSPSSVVLHLKCTFKVPGELSKTPVSSLHPWPMKSDALGVRFRCPSMWDLSRGEGGYQCVAKIEDHSPNKSEAY